MKKYLAIILLIILNNACVNNVDFEQDTSPEIVAPYTFSFVHLTAKTSDFITQSNIDRFTEELSFSISKRILDKIYSDEIKFGFTVENYFKNEFNLEFEFLDNNNNSLLEKDFIIYKNNSNNGKKETQGKFNIALDTFTTIKTIKVTIVPKDPSFTLNDDYRIILTSSLSFDIKYIK